MNNFRNYPAGKCNFPASKVADLSEIYESYKKGGKRETKSQEKIDGERARKVFLDSGSPRFEKRSSRDLDSALEDKNKPRKSDKKPQTIQDHLSEKCDRKPDHLAVTESQLAKAKAVGKISSQKKAKSQRVDALFGSSDAQSSSQGVRGQSPGRKGAPKQKPGAEPGRKSPKKADAAVRAKGSTNLAEPTASSQKDPEKGGKSGELASTASESGKKHINEILKSHAQKIHSASAKSFPVKEYSFQGVSDLLKKVQNVSGAEAAAAAASANGEREAEGAGRSEERQEKGEEIKLEGVRGRTSEKGSREAKERENSEEGKKMPGTWLKLPQSNELERRLRGSWEEPASLFPQDQQPKPEESSEEEKKAKKAKEDGAREEEKRTERRTTYTDRLLLLKMIGKDLEEKKQTTAAKAAAGGGAQGKEPPGRSRTPGQAKEEQDNPIKRHDIVPMNRHLELKCSVNEPVKEVTISKELVPVKEGKASEVEHIFRTKQTRSAELRDMVSQAVKEHKIFCIFDNHSYIVRPVREELLSRGWLEVVPDRRLIPRRRPPPMGPTFERDKTASERNCNTLEAILTAKETFADELQETVSKTPSFRWAVEKPRPLPALAPPAPNKKLSEDSLNETRSQFRIIPPTSERKKNNIEIREFTAKYHAILAKGVDREREIRRLREKEKSAKSLKSERNKSSAPNADKHKPKPDDLSKEPHADEHVILPGSKSFQDILDSIRENKKTIIQAATEIKSIEGKGGAKAELGVLFEAAANGAKELMAAEVPKTQDKMVGTVQEKAVWVHGKAIFTESEVKSISKMIQANNARIHFMWLSIKPAIHLKCFNYSPEIVNKFQRTTFCTKIGLWSHLNNIQWYAHEVHYPAKSPRMYNTGEPDDLQAFFEDFQMTACIGLLKWLSDTFFERGMKAVQTKKGKVPLKAFEFAIKQCERYIRFKENEDLCVLEETKVQNDEWKTFLQWFYIITNDHGKVQESSTAQLMVNLGAQVVYTKAVETLKSIRRHWPEIDIDGRLNIWIMKPYCASCGRGIFMTNNVYYIGQHSKYIVQKYIEKPLLIYNTKFDIRQWFMITKLTPLEIWMYKECYLRFCTQPFALRNLHESVHLSNNSVQRKYISYRDPSLPDQNMWDSNTFRLYLKTIGQPNAWEEIIYPGMRDAIVSTMLASQDTFDGPRKSWFEVYGADFMLSANLKEGPWLIEINENPAMDPSTKVTARLCPQMLRDVIKVVVDKRSNKNASTGQWELIYRQNYSPSFGTVDLDVKGKKIARVPHTKNITNIPPHPSSSPVYMKRRGSNDAEPDRVYDYVKSYEKRQNNRGDASDLGRARGGVKKTRKNPSRRVSPKRGNPNAELAGHVSTSDLAFPETNGGKRTGARGQSDFRAEKYKFTKFYNV